MLVERQTAGMIHNARRLRSLYTTCCSVSDAWHTCMCSTSCGCISKSMYCLIYRHSLKALAPNSQSVFNSLSDDLRSLKSTPVASQDAVGCPPALLSSSTTVVTSCVAQSQPCYFLQEVSAHGSRSMPELAHAPWRAAAYVDSLLVGTGRSALPEEANTEEKRPDITENEAEPPVKRARVD